LCRLATIRIGFIYSIQLLGGKAHFRFEVGVEMGLHGTQRLLTSFKTGKHDGTLKGRNGESRDLLCVDLWADFPRFDPVTDRLK
jgi:hypothetical protein